MKDSGITPDTEAEKLQPEVTVEKNFKTISGLPARLHSLKISIKLS